MKQIFLFTITLVVSITHSFSLDKTLCTRQKVNSYTEYLDAFKKGPCNPIVFIPPLMGTGLKVVADCPTLKANKDTNEQSAFVLKHCPFMCSFGKKYYENMIWAFETPQWKYMYLNDFNFIWKRRECAFHLISVQYEKKTTYDSTTGEESFKFEEVEIPGVQIKIYGDTQETKATSECGRRAMTTTFGYPSNEYALMTLFEKMGYVHGVTLQSVPYDFRRSGPRNEIQQNMKFALKQVNYYTGKRSWLVAHSYGNNNTMYGLKGLTQDEKDKLIREYIAVGAPFLGVLDSLFFLLGANSWLYSPSIEQNFGFKWLSKYFDGVDPYYAKKIYPKLEALYEFLTQPDQFKEQYARFLENLEFLKKAGFRSEFLEDVRRNAEKADIGDVVKKTYNAPTEFNDYTIHDLDKIIEDLAFTDFTKNFHKQMDYAPLSAHRNPGVPVRIVMLTEVLTFSNLILTEDPKAAFDNDRFPTNISLNDKGDQTINLFSLAIPPLNWFVEYQNHKNNKTNYLLEEGVVPKPITFVEFGPRETKYFSDNYMYIKCLEKPQENDYDNQTIWDSFVHGLGYYVYRSWRTGLTIFEKIKRTFWPIRKNTNFVPLSKEEELHQRKNFSGDLKDMFGSETCNHSRIVANAQFQGYLWALMSFPETNNVQSSNEKEVTNNFKQEQDDGLNGLDEESIEKLVDICLTVTCHDGFDACWKQFTDLIEKK